MKKFFYAVAALCMTAITPAKADEGMWILTMLQKLNMAEMQQMGCQLSQEDIYSINNSSIKDAIIIFGGGCTGEIVSDKGLIFTNHHCGYGAIQKLSSVEHNYLRDGYWAKSFNEELPAEGLSVQFVRSIEDVTALVLKDVNEDMDEYVRKSVIDSNITEVEEAAKGKGTRVLVESFFGGNQYFRIVYDVYNDVRLVATPPESIGKFGHDTDNWMWPRHTGDFSIFRVYGTADGKPAAYSPDNVPLKPRHHLPISLKGPEMGDFAMTIGFPGSTDRYLTSMGIQERMDIINQARIDVRGVKQAIWLEDMHADTKVNIQYASKYARSSNYWKNSIGMNRGLRNLDVVAKKQAFEAEFQQWADADADRKALYGDVLPTLKEKYASQADWQKTLNYCTECLLGGAEIYALSISMQSFYDALKNGDKQEQDLVKAKLIERYKGLYKDYNPATDQKVVAKLTKMYVDSIPNADYNCFTEVKDFDKFAADLFKKSIFASEEKLMAFFENPSVKVLDKDPGYNAGQKVYQLYRKLLFSNRPESVDPENRKFIAGIMKMQPERKFYSDANFTIRLSYGTVGDYSPSDAVVYKHYTTLKGVMEKEDSTNWEFNVDPKLKALYEAKDYGRYADKDGSMHVCFTTNNDITGGNSGSPVIDGRGRLIGLAFDGNWEAMSGDIAFETELQKCICVDIRYVLFIIEKLGGATNLIDELTIVND